MLDGLTYDIHTHTQREEIKTFFQGIITDLQTVKVVDTETYRQIERTLE